MEISIKDAIDNIQDRKIQILHGDKDSRVKYSNSIELVDYAKSKGIEVKLHTFNNADHTEGLLTETKRYSEILVSFFNDTL